MTEDQELLQAFRQGSQAAFGELVARYLNLVYSAAMRRTGGDLHLAKDIAQIVFADLARKAPTISPETILAGWLHRATGFAAAQLLRAERRRQAREQEMIAMSANDTSDAAAWEQLRPVLDAAMDELKPEDRDALALRYFEQRSLAEVGRVLNASEDTARKRVDRALDKLREILKRRGLTTTSTALSVVLGVNAVQAAPAGMAVALAGTALVGTTVTTAGVLQFMTITKLQLGIAAALTAAAVITPMAYQQRARARWEAENQALRVQADGARQLHEENTRLSNTLAQGRSGLPEDQARELLRLRSEVGSLRQRTNELIRLQADLQRRLRPAVPAAAAEKTEEEQLRESAILRMNDAKTLVLGMMMHEEDHPGVVITNFSQTTNYLQQPMATEAFELVYQGNRKDIVSPATTIVLRDREPTPQSNGKWLRVYAFADGHSEVHVEPSSDFSTWEKDRLPPKDGQPVPRPINLGQ